VLNKRIELLKDRDHRIGHSYFLEVKNTEEKKRFEKLKEVWFKKILPLFQEYFYGDPKSIYSVLNGKFIEIIDPEGTTEKEKKEIEYLFFEKLNHRDLCLKWNFKEEEDFLKSLYEVSKVKY
jgi:5-methylcytosine-specific restriction protein B